MKHRTLQVLTVSVLLFAYSSGGAAAKSTDEAQASEENTYLVGFDETLDQKLIDEAGGHTGDVWERINAAEVTLTDNEAAMLASQPDVAYVELDEEVQVRADSQLRNWGLDRMKATAAWDDNATGAGVDVAVVDTGISTTHPSLNVAGGYSAMSYTDSFDDDNGHGSHAAGIIGAKQPSAGLVGVAPDADLYAVKVLDEAGNGSLSQVISGLEWAIEEDVDIINMSFGTMTDSNSMKSMLEEAYENDIIVVAASGNRGESSGSGSRVEFPARFDSVVAVGAVDENNERAYFSAAGEAVELAAPGVDIVSTYEGSSFGPLSGTSMATPFVVGAFALLKEAYPDEEAPALRDMLQNEALDLGEDGRDDEYGYGLLQLPDLADAKLDEKNNDDEEENSEQPVEEDIEENPIADDPITDDGDEVDTPTDVDIRVIYNKDGSADVYVYWESSNEEFSHQLYRDGELLDRVDNQESFVDRGMSPGSYRYEVTAVDEDKDVESDKSDAVEVTVEAAGFFWPKKVNDPPAFSDVDDDYWASSPIRQLSARGVIQGINGEFQPGEDVRRGQSLAMIGRLLGWDNTPTDTRFTDVTASYFGSGFVQSATDEGYISGFSDGTFRPNDSITRGQMAAILGNVFEFEGKGSDFVDVDADTTGVGAIAYLADHGVVTGYDDGNFRPGETLSRAQFASIFYNLGEHLQ